MTLAKTVQLLQQRTTRKGAFSAFSVEFSVRNRLAAGANETCTRRLRFLSSARPLPEDYPIDDHQQQNPLPPASRFSTRRQPSPSPPVRQNSTPAPFPRKTAQETYSIVEDKKQAITANVRSAAGIPTPTDSVQENLNERTSPTSIKYTGDTVIPITSVLDIIKPQDDTPRGIWPVFRLMVSVFF